MTDYMSGNPNKAPLEPYFLGMGEGERNRSFNMLVRNVAKADQTGREFGLIEMSGVKGLGAPPHSHGNEAESFFGLEGTVRVWVGEQDALVHPGDFVFIPRHLRHKFRIESEYAKFLCLITPGSGFEDFFHALGESTTDAFPTNPEDFREFPSIEDIAEVAPRFNWYLEQDWT
jgi:quercetin dioxygenase-like cupin family protein